MNISEYMLKSHILMKSVNIFCSCGELEPMEIKLVDQVSAIISRITLRCKSCSRHVELRYSYTCE